MKQILSSDDIMELVHRGEKVLRPSGDFQLTEIARELMVRHGIALAQPGPAAPLPSPSQPAENFARGLGQALANSPVTAKAPVPHTACTGDMGDLYIHNARIVLPEAGVVEGGILVREGKVAAILSGSPGAVAAAETLDAGGNYLLPGIIDPHVHLGMFAPLEEELESESRSALLGGVTTIGCFFNQADSYLPLLDALPGQLRTHSGVDLFPHLTLREELHLQEAEHYRACGVSSFKSYMCGIPGLLPHQTDAFIVRTMARLNTLPGKPVLCVHCENTSLVDAGLEDLQSIPNPSLSQWSDSHPAMAEEEALIRAVYFARKMGVTLYAVHISTRDAITTAASIKGEGIHIETTSPYLTVDDSTALPAESKMAPPIRDRASVDALWQALSTGVLDTIGTDNVTMTLGEKNAAGGMAAAVPGYPALGTHLVSVLDQGLGRNVPIEAIVPKMTMNPAKIFGLYPRKGTLLPGSDADMVIVDPNLEQTVRPQELGSRSDFSLFQGRSLRGWPVVTIKGGRVVCRDGQVVGRGQGCFLPR